MKLHAELIFIWRFRTYIRFPTEAQENSEMAYYVISFYTWTFIDSVSRMFLSYLSIKLPLAI